MSNKCLQEDTQRGREGRHDLRVQKYCVVVTGTPGIGGPARRNGTAFKVVGSGDSSRRSRYQWQQQTRRR
ncbi:hypothetical protein EVAR_33574_1 [Eumeta japonica]|uniref:Uncharacterized protein n=1 Tax=Eumeta variegata TaxID=151549 RepID=A0A4C1VJR2_EUMVA|nr:hypothetical protein EVAR_33574_1 [Eumeta japonica]